MKKVLPYLHPNPGWEKSEAHETKDPLLSVTPDMVGKHCILELYECDEFKLNDESFIRDAITVASKLAGATLINLITHGFEPRGVTGLALLAESHISIHTWPETCYAAVDVFTCGDHTMPERACEILRIKLNAKRFSLRSLNRQIPEVVKTPFRKVNQSTISIS